MLYTKLCLGVILLLLFLSCGTVEKEVEPIIVPEMLAGFYETLQIDVMEFGYAEGQWTEDYGDAAAFGAYYFSHIAADLQTSEYLQIADESMAYNLQVVQQATDDFAWMLTNLEEVFMSAQGLIEYTSVFQEDSNNASIEALLDSVDPLVQSTGDYMDVSIGEFAADLYGPTSITAGMAVAYTQYALHDEGEFGQKMSLRAQEIAETIHQEAFHIDHYRFHPDNEKQYLYPNSTMLILLMRLHELTGDAKYLNRAELVYEGIQPLRNDSMGFYRSPYSEEAEGAETDEYSTLSSQNYLMMGLATLYQATADPIYLEDIFQILDHIYLRLYDDEEHKILHHWIDGRVATPNDPSYFCSGCNLQTLFILWYLQSVVGVEF